MKPRYPYIEDFCDDTVYVFSTIGQGPKGEKGDRGDAIVPIFSDPLEWDINSDYEDLSVVTYQGSTYTAKKPVPAGIDIHNKNYWAKTADFNAQLEACRNETSEARNIATMARDDIVSEANQRRLADDDLRDRIDHEVTRTDQLTLDLQGEILARVNSDVSQGNEIVNLRNFNNRREFSNRTINSNTIVNLSEKGKITLPNNRKVACIAVNSGYLYVVGISSNDTDCVLYTYNYDDLSLVQTLSLPDAHFNSMDFNPDGNALYIISQNPSSLLVIVDVSSNSIVKTKTFNSASIGSIAICPSIARIAIRPAVSGRNAIYQRNPDAACNENYIRAYATEQFIVGNTLVQDACGTDDLILTLCAAIGSVIVDNNAQYIACVKWDGTVYKYIYLPYTQNELEGIAVKDNILIIVDVAGNVYTSDLGDKINTDHAKSSLSTTFQDIITAYDESSSCVKKAQSTKVKVAQLFQRPDCLVNNALIADMTTSKVVAGFTRDNNNRFTATASRIFTSRCIISVEYYGYVGIWGLKNIGIYSFADGKLANKGFTDPRNDAQFASELAEFDNSCSTNLPILYNTTVLDSYLFMPRAIVSGKNYMLNNIPYIPSVASSD